MRSENPDAELATTLLAGRGIGVPVAFSVLLHVAVLSLFARAAFAPPAEARLADERPSLSVALVMRTPPRAPERVTQPTEAASEADAAAELAEPAATTEALVAEELPDAGLDEAATQSGTAAWTPASIRAAVGIHVSKQRNTLIETWVADCILEQKEHGTRDCAQQQEVEQAWSSGVRAGRDAADAAFAGITRPQQQARLTEGLLKGNVLMASLMEDADEAGDLAAQRDYLNREYLLYLNGNAGDPIFATMQDFRADVTGGPRLSLPGNIRFRCKRSPCVYQYTGFEVQGPEAEDDANAFRVVPTVFGDRH